MTTESMEQSLIAHALKDIVLPWVERDGMANVFTAYSKWHPEMDLPEGMTATRKPLRGKRVPIRSRRPYGSTSWYIARWPEDNLTAIRASKLCLVLDGRLDIQVNNYVLHCPPGHGLLLPSGTAFSYPLIDPARQNRKTLKMLQTVLHRESCVVLVSSTDSSGRNNETTCSIPYSQAPFYLNQLVEEVKKRDSYHRTICDNLLRIAIAFLFREVEQLPVLQVTQIPEQTRPKTAEDREHSILLAQKHIYHHLREPLSIDHVARYVCMSRATFTAQFRAQTGKTFARYIQDLRFAEACKLLQGGDLGIQHVCAAVGLTPKWMRVLFHERRGVSPLEFRRQSRSNAALKNISR